MSDWVRAEVTMDPDFQTVKRGWVLENDSSVVWMTEQDAIALIETETMSEDVGEWQWEDSDGGAVLDARWVTETDNDLIYQFPRATIDFEGHLVDTVVVGAPVRFSVRRIGD